MAEDTRASLNDEYDRARAAWDLARQELWGALGPVSPKSWAIAREKSEAEEDPTSSELHRLERAKNRAETLKVEMDTIVKRLCILR
jgi:hypothetical protein